MKTRIILALFCGALGATAITSGASPATNSDDGVTLAAADGFSVQFAFTEDARIFSSWDKPVPPHFAPVSVARRKVPFFAVVIFTGAGLSSDGKADVTYDVVIRKPDGSVYGQEKGLVAAQGRMDPSPKALHVAHDCMGVRIEAKDPSGTYIAELVLRDNVRKSELRAKRSFTVEK